MLNLEHQPDLGQSVQSRLKLVLRPANFRARAAMTYSSYGLAPGKQRPGALRLPLAPALQESFATQRNLILPVKSVPANVDKSVV